MKKNSNKPKTQAPDQHFVNAARQLLANYKTPGEFLLFLNEALHWVHEQQVHLKEYSIEQDHHYSLLVLVEEIVVPWIKSGNDKVTTIAECMRNVYYENGWEDHQSMVNNIISALAARQNADGQFYPEVMIIHMKGINTLCQIGLCFCEYKRQDEKKEEQLKIAS